MFASPKGRYLTCGESCRRSKRLGKSALFDATPPWAALRHQAYDWINSEMTVR